jgi:hypothetical protein
VIYCLDQEYILVREDYLRWHADGVYQETGSSWIESLPGYTQDGYRILKSDCLLILVTILSKRVQCNYHMLPALWNYVYTVDES